MNKVIIDKPAPKILLIMFRRIGDILLTTPVPAELKRLMPSARIFFLVEKAFCDVISLNPFIDHIFLLEKNLHSQSELIRKIREEKFTFVFDFQSNPRSALLTLFSGAEYTFGYHFRFRIRNKFYQHTLRENTEPVYAVEHRFNLLRMAGFRPENYKTYFYFSDSDKIYAEKVLQKLEIKGKKFAIFSTTSRRPANRWLPDYFAEIAMELNKVTGIIPAFIYGPSEKEYVSDIYKKCRGSAKLVPEMTLKQIGALLSMADFVLGLDNGLKHLAVTVETPTFTIFGPSQPAHWTPPDEKHTWIRANVECIQCYKTRCDDMKCMKVLTPPLVFNKLLKFIKEDIKINLT